VGRGREVRDGGGQTQQASRADSDKTATESAAPGTAYRQKKQAASREVVGLSVAMRRGGRWMNEQERRLERCQMRPADSSGGSSFDDCSDWDSRVSMPMQ
jgi:hypothetical protein